jgi:ligand-binding SRPBCC domain-containing protein
MGHLQLSAHIDAPIGHVWDVNASCDRLPEWNVNIIEVRDCPGRLDRVGARFTVVVRIFGRRIEGSEETTKADQPHTYELTLSGPGGARATLHQTFTEARGGTDTVADVDYELPMRLFAGVADRLLHGSVERDLRHSLESFGRSASRRIRHRRSAPPLRDAPSGSGPPVGHACGASRTVLGTPASRREGA